MEIVLSPVEVPLRKEDDGILRVGQTRVLVDLVLNAYKSGFSAEDIAEQFTAISLGQVYAVIAYYLQNQSQLDEYLAESDARADVNRREIEARQADSELRKRVIEILRVRDENQE